LTVTGNGAEAEGEVSVDEGGEGAISPAKIEETFPSAKALLKRLREA